MNRILPVIYTLSTVLIIVGALFIFQEETYGLTVLSLGLVMNILYRSLTLNFDGIKAYKLMDLLRFGNIVLMTIACVLFYTEWDQKFNLLVLAILFDLLLNFKEISFKRK